MADRFSRRSFRFSYLFAAATLGFAVGKTSHAWPNSPLGQVHIQKALIWPLLQAKDATTPDQRRRFLQTVKRNLRELDGMTQKWRKSLGLDRQTILKTLGLSREEKPKSIFEIASDGSNRYKPNISAIKTKEQQVANQVEYERRRKEGVKLPRPNMKAVRQMEQHDADMEEYERRKREEEEARCKGVED